MKEIFVIFKYPGAEMKAYTCLIFVSEFRRLFWACSAYDSINRRCSDELQ
jgi:hypothetical protein